MLLYNKVYLPHFIISPSNTQSHTQQCSITELCPVTVSVPVLDLRPLIEGTQGREGLQRPPLKCRFKQ